MHKWGQFMRNSRLNVPSSFLMIRTETTINSTATVTKTLEILAETVRIELCIVGIYPSSFWFRITDVISQGMRASLLCWKRCIRGDSAGNRGRWGIKMLRRKSICARWFRTCITCFDWVTVGMIRGLWTKPSWRLLRLSAKVLKTEILKICPNIHTKSTFRCSDALFCLKKRYWGINKSTIPVRWTFVLFIYISSARSGAFRSHGIMVFRSNIEEVRWVMLKITDQCSNTRTALYKWKCLVTENF